VNIHGNDCEIVILKDKSVIFEMLVHGSRNFILATTVLPCRIERLTIHSDGNILRNLNVGALNIFGGCNFFDNVHYETLNDYGEDFGGGNTFKNDDD